MKKNANNPSPSSPRKAPPGTSRRLGFRLSAIVAPVVALILLELILRGMGVGYPTAFFLKTRISGRDVYVENQEFGRRYFPPGLERTPQPVVLDAIKAHDSVRVFVFGESAAMGDPDPSYAFSRQLELMLRDVMPGKRVDVINVALTAINSHVVRDIARDCVDKQGDYWIVYLGNNEVVGPFGAGTVFGDQVPGLGFIRANLALKSFRIGQLADAFRWRITGGGNAPRSWEGMEMFLQQRVPSGDPRLARTYDHFAINLREIIGLGRKAGAQVLVATVAANVKDCAPFASVHRPDLEAAGRVEWQRLFEAGRTNWFRTNLAEAVQSFVQARQIDDRPAELHYALGRTLLGLGQTNQARESLERARELDALRFRADARINQILREAAAETGARLVDLSDAIADRSSHGIAGEEFLFEHVHFNFDGNYEVAKSLASEISRTATGTNFPARDDCARRLAFTKFDSHRVLDEMRQRLELPPFNQQIDHASRRQRIEVTLEETRSAGFSEANAAYELAIAARPDDWVLRENFGTLLKDFGQLEEALVQWKKMVELVPHSADACIGLADTLDAAGQSADAVIWFRRAMLRRPGSIEIRHGLALALMGAGDHEGAGREFEQIVRRKPGFAEARVNWGRLLAQRGKVSEARAQYLEAIRWNSNSAAAYINLGKLLALEGRTDEAAAQYREAVRARPGSEVAHFNLGNALTTLSDHAGALRHYAEASRLNPRFVEARYAQGLSLTRLGQNTAAMAEFSEVVRLDPKFAEAHFNLGVALAKAGRFAEAAERFEQTLQLEPGHARAAKFLEQARARQREVR